VRIQPKKGNPVILQRVVKNQSWIKKQACCSRPAIDKIPQEHGLAGRPPTATTAPLIPELLQQPLQLVRLPMDVTNEIALGQDPPR